MIDIELSNKVLTIGNQSENPDGGISYVLYCYRKYVFQKFHIIVNFRRGNFLYKLLIAVWAYICELVVLLFNWNIKIVHVHTASGIAFKRSRYYIALAHVLGRKVIVHMHSGRFNEYWQENKTYVDKVLSKCYCVVALSVDLKNFYESLGCRIAVVLDNIIVPPQRTDLRYNDGKVHLLFLGVITKTKGIYDLIEVINEHKNEFEGKLMLHVGGNSEVEVLQQMIHEWQLQGVVTFEGWLSGDAKCDALNKCDAFILPSYTEGVPISILEALSYGKYIISTNVGGIPGVVDEKSGVLLPPQNKDCLYEALKDVIEKKEYKNNVQYRIDKSASFMPENVSRQLESLYNEILSGKTVGGGKI